MNKKDPLRKAKLLDSKVAYKEKPPEGGNSFIYIKKLDWFYLDEFLKI